MEKKRSARMTAIPQLDVPDILVDDEDSHPVRVNQDSQGPAPSRAPSTYLSAEDARAQHHRSWSGNSVDISMHEGSYAHPLSMPRSGGPGGQASPTTPGGGSSHRYNTSAFSFDIQEPTDGQPESNHSSRRTSAVSPAQLREMLDDSVWLDSIRRSATQRRSGY